MNRYRQVAWLLLALGLIGCVWKIASSANRQPFAFLDHTHPVSRHLDQSGTWTYYSLSGEPKKYVEEARSELLAKGFTEDATKKPWFRFTKGVHEVIVCNHGEIAAMYDPVKGTYPVHISLASRYKNPRGWAVAWVHDESKSKINYWSFQAKRFILQW